MACNFYDDAFLCFPSTDYAEYALRSTYGFNETVYLKGEIARAPEFAQTDTSLRVEYYTSASGLALVASCGNVDANHCEWSYWSISGSYAVNDNVTLDVTYHDADVYPAPIGGLRHCQTALWRRFHVGMHLVTPA